MTTTRILVGCTIAMLCSSLTLAGYLGIDLPNRRESSSISLEIPEPEPNWTQSKDGFSAMLLLSDAPDDVLRTWEDPDSAEPVRMAETIVRGVPIVAFVFFAGCVADEEGLCNASVDFTILRPDGSEYDRFTDRDLWKLKPAPPEGMLRLSAEYVGVVIEAQDPLGEYEIQVSVHDLVGGTTLDLSRPFTAIDSD